MGQLHFEIGRWSPEENHNRSQMESKEKEILELSVRQFQYQMSQTLANGVNAIHSRVKLAVEDAPDNLPDPEALNGILENHRKAPGSTPIAAVPNSPTDRMYDMLTQIQLLESYIAILTAYCIYNEHPEPYDITDGTQAMEFIQAEAKWKNYVLTGGIVKKLQAYLPLGEAVAYSMKKTVTNADIHAELLSALFGGFGFTKAVMTELDSILTNVASTLKGISLKFEKINQTMNHLISYYYFETVPGTGGGEGQPPAMYQVVNRLFFLKINQKSWKVTIMKSSVSHFSFDANYFDSKAVMNSSMVGEDKQLISDSIKRLTKKDTAAINKLVDVKPIKQDPIPA
ncbi:MAG: hypothetical protein AAF363_07990 [Bacteroidota bacterium]